MSSQRERYLEAMGIQVWSRREAPGCAVDSVAPAGPLPPPPAEAPPVAELTPEPPAPAMPPSEPSPVVESATSAEAGLDWDGLQTQVSGCERCPELVANRTQTVFGVGARNARLLIIGEAPGADEDRQGEPFVGRAGQLLNNMLRAIGLERQQVYIANILKCRPPNNRDPKPEEAANCAAYLHRQIALVAPEAILVVGRIAAQNLLQSEQPIGRLRGHEHRFGSIPVVVTYHPAYLLRSPAEKRKAWSDLKQVRQLLGPAAS